MKRQSLAKLLGGLALIGPISAPVWAAGKTDRAPVQIYSSDDVIQRQIAQNTVAPEQVVPQGTESRPMTGGETNAAPQSGQASAPTTGIMLGSTRVYGWIDQGITFNFDRPHDRLNFGRLFDDRSNDYRFNQAVINFEKALSTCDPCCPDWGYKLEFLYGSDARFIHSLGFMDNITDETVQPDIVEAYVSYHAPILTSGGVDFKVGQFVTLMGMDVINAPSNMLYSHNYIFNFGIPFKHTGVLATTHVSDQVDVLTGLVTGINTGSFDDNNDAWAFHGGVMWHDCDNSNTVGLYLHAGPEADGNWDRVFGVESNDDFRYIIDLVANLKLNECTTWTSEVNFGKDNAFDAEWYGVCTQLAYKVNPCVTFVVRGEVFRDDDGFAVFKDKSNDGFVDFERGNDTPDGSGIIPGLVSGKDTTYGELTFGVNVKPYENLLFRPEVRWDWASGNKPFDDSSDNDQFTLGFDMIWSF